MRELKRRKMGYWEPFNVWWREHVAKHDKRPKVHEMKKWYEANAESVWGGTGPTWEETKKHSKGMRRIEDISDYFRQYRRGRRKKAAGCSIDTDTTDSDMDEVERASTPDSNDKHTHGPQSKRKMSVGSSGVRSRGRPKQHEVAETACPTTSQEQASLSGSSGGNLFPPIQPLQLVMGSAVPSSAVALLMTLPDGAPTTASRDAEKENKVEHLLAQQYHQHQRHFQIEKEPFPQHQHQQHLALQHQQRASSSTLPPASIELRTSSASQIATLHQMRNGSAALPPSNPAPPPPQQQQLLRLGMGAMPPVPQSSYPPCDEQMLDDGKHKHLLQHHVQQPHPLALETDNPYSHCNPHHQPESQPRDRYTHPSSPPEPQQQQHYPKILGMPVPSLPFFSGWRSRSTALPPHQQPPASHGHPHGPPHATAHPSYMAHSASPTPPPAAAAVHMQRSMTMPRPWSQQGTAPAPMQRRVAPWGMMTRMLSMPRSIGSSSAMGPLPLGMQQHPMGPPPLGMQQHPMGPPPRHLPKPSMPGFMTSQPTQQQHVPAPQSSTFQNASSVYRAGSDIFHGIAPFMRGNPPLPQAADSYLDLAAVAVAPYESHNSESSPTLPPSSYSPTRPCTTASPSPLAHMPSSPNAQTAAGSPPHPLLPTAAAGGYLNAAPPQLPTSSDSFMSRMHAPQPPLMHLQPQAQSQPGLQPIGTNGQMHVLSAPVPAPESEPQAPTLSAGPPPDPFRSRTHVMSLPRHYEVPPDTDLHQPGDTAEAGANTANHPISDKGAGDRGLGDKSDTQLGDQHDSGRLGNAKGSGSSSSSKLGGLYTRGSTMRRVWELFKSWAGPEADVAAPGSSGVSATAKVDDGPNGDAEASLASVPAPATPSSGLLWGRSVSNPRSCGSPRQGPAQLGSPEPGPNPFRQQLQRLGSMSNTWLLGKRSRDEGSPMTQGAVTPTSRKLQRGISGIFRPLVEMMSFGRRTSQTGGPFGTAFNVASAAAAAVAEVEAEEAAAAAAATSDEDHVEVAPGQMDAVIAPYAGTGDAMVGGHPEASRRPAPVALQLPIVSSELPQAMSCLASVDGERLFLETLDSHVLASMVIRTPVADTQQHPQPSLMEQEGQEISTLGPAVVSAATAAAFMPPPPPPPLQSLVGLVAPGPAAADMAGQPLNALMPPPSTGAQHQQVAGGSMPYASQLIALQHPPLPPASTSGAPMRGPVITTGATGAGAGRPQGPTRPQPPFGSFPQLPDTTLPTPSTSLWLPTDQESQTAMRVCQPKHADELHLSCDGLKPQPPSHVQQQEVPTEDVSGNGGMFLRLSNSLTDYLRQAWWGQVRG